MFTMCYLEMSMLENFYFLNELQRIYSMGMVTFRKISLKTKQNFLSVQKNLSTAATEKENSFIIEKALS